MPRYFDTDDRYPDGGDNFIERDEGQRTVIIENDNSQIDQVTTEQVTANQNNYALPPGSLIVFSTDASRNFTGFSNARPGLTVFYNGGSFDGVIVNNSASSTAENRTLCHTAGNITLNPGESAILAYNFAASRWITVGFV